MAVTDNLAVIKAVLFYMATSITMVMANKWVLSSLPDLPLFFLWLQVLVAVALIYVTHLLGIFRLPSKNASLFPSVSFTKSRKLSRLIAVNVAGLAANTLCLKYVEASLYQVARSLILPFTVIMQRVFLKQPSSLTTIMCCAIVCTGFVVGIYGDRPSSLDSETSNDGDTGVTFSGALFGVVSSLTTAFHAIVIKESIAVVDGNTIELVWYNNVLTLIAMVPLVLLSGEFSKARDFFIIIATSDSTNGSVNSFTSLTSEEGAYLMKTFVLGTLVTGVFGYLINIAGFLQIKVTSPVTHMISSAVRGVLQTFLAVWLFSDVLTTSRVCGIALVLIGSSWYAYDKSLPKEPVKKTNVEQQA